MRKFTTCRPAWQEINKSSYCTEREMPSDGNLELQKRMKIIRNVNMWVNTKDYCFFLPLISLSIDCLMQKS